MSADPPSMTDSQRLVRIETLLEEWHKTHDDHETRLRSLERRMWLAIGAAAVGGGLASQVVQTMLGQ